MSFYCVIDSCQQATFDAEMPYRCALRCLSILIVYHCIDRTFLLSCEAKQIIMFPQEYINCGKIVHTDTSVMVYRNLYDCIGLNCRLCEAERRRPVPVLRRGLLHHRRRPSGGRRFLKFQRCLKATENPITRTPECESD